MAFSRIAFFLFVSLLLTACSGSRERKAPVTPSAVLNNLVRSASYQYITLDDSDTRDIKIMNKDLIYSVFGKKLKKEPILGRMNSVTFNDHRFYVYDISARAICTIDQKGTVKGPLTRQGSGPGEHNSFGHLYSNSHYIYNTDLNNGRINRYDRDMRSVKPLQEFTSSSQKIAVNDRVMLTANRNSSGFSPPNPEEGLITISRIDNLQDTLSTILPRIIPAGYQPQVYNNPMFSVNSKGEIAASYRPLPWLFIFDADYNLQKTLIFTYSVFREEMDIPEMEIFKPKGNRGYGGSVPFGQFKLLDNGDIFISIQKELIHLSRSADGEYRADKYRLLYPARDDTLWISDIYPAASEQKYYAANWNYLFEITLPSQ